MSIDLDAIQARADAASKPPWRLANPRPDGRNMVERHGYDLYGGEVSEMIIVDTNPADATFIAAARTDVPALLAYARDLEARVGRVEEVHKPKSWTKYGIPCFDEFDSPTARINGCTCGNEHYPCPTIAAITAMEARV